MLSGVAPGVFAFIYLPFGCLLLGEGVTLDIYMYLIWTRLPILELVHQPLSL
jgi:hypothetical protein